MERYSTFGIRRLSTVSSPSWICRFNAIPVNSPGIYFVTGNKLILKFRWRAQRLRRVTTRLKKNRVGGIMQPAFNTCHKATVVQTAWYWRKQTTSSNRTQQPAQKQTPTSAANCIPAKEQRKHSRGKMTSSANGATTNGPRRPPPGPRTLLPRTLMVAAGKGRAHREAREEPWVCVETSVFLLGAVCPWETRQPL